MPYILVRDLEPDLRRRLSDSARKNKRGLSDEAIALIERVLAEQRADHIPDEKRSHAISRRKLATTLRSKKRAT
jgi:hypothetical protein